LKKTSHRKKEAKKEAKKLKGRDNKKTERQYELSLKGNIRI